MGKMVDPNEVDETTVKRCASLAAYGFGDQQVADTLVVSVAQVLWAKETEIYKTTLGQKQMERAQAAIDMTEGWDSIESQGIATVMEALQWNRDPKFALAAAVRANQAKRHVGQTARTIDASKAGTVIHLTMNQRFVETTVKNDNRIVNAGVVDTSQPRQMKYSDMPSPKQVTDLLAPARPLLEKIREQRIADQMEELNFGNLDEDE